MSDPIRTFRHFCDVPDTLWRWPNFSPAEIACRGTGALKLHPEALDKLQALRDRLGKPLIVRSAYRSPAHNRAVGGAPASKHMDGTAFDIAMANHDPVAFEAAARAAGFLGLGFYPRSGFIHVDLGPARVWGAPFPARAVAFAEETPPAREALAESRTLRGTGAAGVATIGAGGVEVAQEALAEAQGAILPLVPYLDTLRWVFIALALAGIAVAVWARVDDWKRGAALMLAAIFIEALARPWARRAAAFALAALTILLFLLNLRRAGERAGRATERLETLERTNAIQRQMLDAAARRPRSRDDILERLRGGSSDTPRRGCPPVVEYSRAEQARVAEEVAALPDGALIMAWLADYAVLRDQARGVRALIVPKLTKRMKADGQAWQHAPRRPKTATSPYFP